MKIYKYMEEVIYGEGWLDELGWHSHKKLIRDIIDREIDPVGYDMFGTDFGKNEIKIFWAKKKNRYIGYSAADFTDYFSVWSPVLGKEQNKTLENHAKLYVYVVPEYRRLGVGRILYRMAENEILEFRKKVLFFPSDEDALLFQMKMFMEGEKGEKVE